MRALWSLVTAAGLVLGTAGPAAADVLNLTWTDNAANEDGFVVERGTDPSGPFAEIARVAVDARAYSDVTVEPGATYCYRVRAFNAAGVSAASNTACGIAAAAALPALSVSVLMDGSTMIVTATLVPGTTPTVVDAYVVLQLPDGSLASLVAASTLVPGIAPAAVGVAPVAFSGEVFRYTFTGTEPRGTYRWYAALAASGTASLVGNIAQASLAY